MSNSSELREFRAGRMSNRDSKASHCNVRAKSKAARARHHGARAVYPAAAAASVGARAAASEAPYDALRVCASVPSVAGAIE